MTSGNPLVSSTFLVPDYKKMFSIRNMLKPITILGWMALAPRSWNCDFKNFIKDFHLIHIGPSNEERSKALEKLEKVLSSAKIPQEQIEKIAEAVRNGTTNHATYMSKDREKVLKSIENDKYVKDYLRKIYYHDYKVFGFTIKDNK